MRCIRRSTAVRSRLQRRVHVSGDARRLRHQLQQVVGEIHRLDRAEPQALDIGLAQDRPDQIGEAHGPGSALASPASEIDAGENDLAIAAAELANLLEHLSERRALTASTDGGNDAERAAVVAAVLDLQIGARVRSPAASFTAAERKSVRREDVADVDLAVVIGARNKIGDLRFMRIADHPLDAGQRRQFFRRALRVAAGDQDAGVAVLAVDAPDGLPHVVIGRGGDGAGVEDHQVGLLALTRREGPSRRAALRARRHRLASRGSRSSGRRRCALFYFTLVSAAL